MSRTLDGQHDDTNLRSYESPFALAERRLSRRECRLATVVGRFYRPRPTSLHMTIDDRDGVSRGHQKTCEPF